jgi:hypothetical protein
VRVERVARDTKGAQVRAFEEKHRATVQSVRAKMRRDADEAVRNEQVLDDLLHGQGLHAVFVLSHKIFPVSEPPELGQRLRGVGRRRRAFAGVHAPPFVLQFLPNSSLESRHSTLLRHGGGEGGARIRLHAAADTSSGNTSHTGTAAA